MCACMEVRGQYEGAIFLLLRWEIQNSLRKGLLFYVSPDDYIFYAKLSVFVSIPHAGYKRACEL